MSHSLLHDIATKVNGLSSGEKQILLEQLAQDLRDAKRDNAEVAAALVRMAADPDIQREIRDIEQEFADAAEDGLEDP